MGERKLKGNARTIEHLNIITNKKMQILINVVRKYKLELITAEKVRSAYKITTDNGDFCLKKMRHGRSKVKNGCILTEELLLNNFTNTPKYFRTKDGAFSVSYKKNIYYLTEWLEGCECDLTDIDEAVSCTKLLAQFHNVSNKIDHNKIHIPNNLKDWPKIFTNDLNDFKRFERIITNKRIKNEFDIHFLENIDNFYNRGMSSVNILNKSQYYKSSKIANVKKIICHNNFRYHNIIKKDGEYFIINLDSIMSDLQISDLGKLLRRLMFEKAYGWNFNFAKVLIEAYNSTNKLSKEDLEIMLALIIFPHKFWKLAKKRYMKQKKWSETKYLNKLNKITCHNEAQEKFFNEYLNFLEEYS
ncbi:CotS family spore coat protein [Clostridium sp. CM028]|nr:CotS family spore coat protein [Clostridium sp. CM028]WLC61991.1 CotS family spore coat protein [Clostridium sp. CM028]